MATLDAEFPLVTVGVPLYNHGRYVRDCLDSIVAEGYPELELVVVDDGSTDGSLQAVQEWMDANRSRLRRAVVLTQENRGICPTLNRLIRESRGEFFLGIASDDRLRPGGILARVRAMQEHPEAMAVMTNLRVIDEDGNVLTDDGLFRYFDLSRPHLLDERTRPAEILLNAMQGPLLFVRRSAFLDPDGIGLYDEAFSFEDRDFFLRILARPGALQYLDANVADYRIHPDNHVGTHVRDKTRHARVARDYVTMGRRHAGKYQGSLRRAILLDAWMVERRGKAEANPLLLKALTRGVQRYKRKVLAAQRRAAEAPA
jgi:glycosyltransferase involved in cell wall biosynthesis